MPDEEMIERVARAILETPSSSDYERLVVIRLVVIRVIEAMRIPTEKMLSAENVHKICHTCGGSVEGYQAMIDAILK